MRDITIRTLLHVLLAMMTLTGCIGARVPAEVQPEPSARAESQPLTLSTGAQPKAFVEYGIEAPGVDSLSVIVTGENMELAEAAARLRRQCHFRVMADQTPSRQRLLATSWQHWLQWTEFNRLSATRRCVHLSSWKLARTRMRTFLLRTKYSIRIQKIRGSTRAVWVWIPVEHRHSTPTQLHEQEIFGRV